MAVLRTKHCETPTDNSMSENEESSHVWEQISINNSVSGHQGFSHVRRDVATARLLAGF